MVIIIGVAAGVALLYFWLVGWWFARVLVFLLLGAIAFSAGGMWVNAMVPSGGVSSIAVGLLCLIPAWLVASIPIYYWRHQLRQILREAQPTTIRSEQRFPSRPLLSSEAVIRSYWIIGGGLAIGASGIILQAVFATN